MAFDDWKDDYRLRMAGDTGRPADSFGLVLKSNEHAIGALDVSSPADWETS